MKSYFKIAINLFYLIACLNLSAQNLIEADDDDWAAGTNGATLEFDMQGDSSQNSRINHIGPFGDQVVVWQASANGASGMNGGLSHKGQILNTSKSYRVSFWMKSTGPNNCLNRSGYTPYQTNDGQLITSTERLDGTNTSWPYFLQSNLPNDQWYLVVGFIRPNNYTGNNSGGVYDPSLIDLNNPNILPNPSFTTTDFKFPSNQSEVSARIRSFMWNCGSGEYQYIYEPRIEEVNGLEVPLTQLLSPNSNTVDTESPQITSFSSSNTVQNGTTISWSATDNVAITEYALIMNGVTQTLSSTITTTFTADNLTSSTTYNFQLLASDAANNTVTSQVLSVTTLAPGETSVSEGQWSTATNENDVYYNTGNVGIGTTTPDVKLAVNGHIRAKEIKVENANWPDYVFSKDYELLSLKEIQKHIQEKGHLPNMPSAKEVEANGIELGEMNKLLLEKIEELTLYILEQEKRIEKLENQN